jgi:hypothetical protein
MNEGGVHYIQFIVTSKYSSKFLYSPVETLYFVSSFVQFLIVPPTALSGSNPFAFACCDEMDFTVPTVFTFTDGLPPLFLGYRSEKGKIVDADVTTLHWKDMFDTIK